MLLYWPLVACSLYGASAEERATSQMMQVAISPQQWRGEQKPDTRVPSRLIEALPAPVYWLFQWPEPAVLNGPKRIDSSAKKAAGAARQYREWIEKALNPIWHPPTNAELTILRDEFQGRDTARMSWEKNGFRIRASQTASAFTVQLTPLGDTGSGESTPEKYDRAKNLCSQLFANEGFRWGSDPGVRIPVPELAQKIVGYSFQPTLFRELKNDGSVLGWAVTMEDKGIRPAKSEPEAVRERHFNNENWPNTELAWRYWFRNVNWYNNGKNIGFYFLKIEEGSWIPSYDDQNRDKNWLR